MSPNHTDHSFSIIGGLTIACSILLSMATTLAPDALQRKRVRINQMLQMFSGLHALDQYNLLSYNHHKVWLLAGKA